jgi:hypothetical protein
MCSFLGGKGDERNGDARAFGVFIERGKKMRKHNSKECRGRGNAKKEMIEAKENKENDKLKAYVKAAGGRSVFAMDISVVGSLLVRYA